MRVAFIKNNTVMHIYKTGDIYKIMKRNLKKDWQAIIDVNNPEVQKGWIYNPDTGDLTRPEES